MIVSASVTGYRNNIYINPVNNEALVEVDKAINGKEVASIEGVNHGVIDILSDGSFYFFQASGYTPERGMFCDMLECKPSDYPDKAKELVKKYLVNEFDQTLSKEVDNKIGLAYTQIDDYDGKEYDIQVTLFLDSNVIKKELTNEEGDSFEYEEKVTMSDLDNLNFNDLIWVAWNKIKG